jgi:hypothetical protein
LDNQIYDDLQFTEGKEKEIWWRRFYKTMPAFPRASSFDRTRGMVQNPGNIKMLNSDEDLVGNASAFS